VGLARRSTGGNDQAAGHLAGAFAMLLQPALDAGLVIRPHERVLVIPGFL
jgi:hypothetical protein